MTDPGPPPEEALDATLRALGAPVPAQTRRTPESAGLDAAHYHAEPHLPPKPYEPPSSSSRVATTEPMATAVQPNVERDTIRMEPREQRNDLTTVPRAAAAPSRMSTFLAALAFVLLVLGVATWALIRGGSQPDQPVASAPTGGGSMAAGSAGSSVVSAATAAVVVPAPVPAPPSGSFVAPIETSVATADPPRPTGRPQPTAAAMNTALPRHAPTGATSGAAAAPTQPPAIATSPVAPPAPTTKYNHLLGEDKQ